MEERWNKWDAIWAALAWPGLRGSDKNVLVALSMHGRRSFASTAALAAEVAATPKSVERSLARLRDVGAITTERVGPRRWEHTVHPMGSVPSAVNDVEG